MNAPSLTDKLLSENPIPNGHPQKVDTDFFVVRDPNGKFHSANVDKHWNVEGRPTPSSFYTAKQAKALVRLYRRNKATFAAEGKDPNYWPELEVFPVSLVLGAPVSLA